MRSFIDFRTYFRVKLGAIFILVRGPFLREEGPTFGPDTIDGLNPGPLPRYATTLKFRVTRHGLRY